MTLKNSNSDETQKLKIGTKLKNSNSDKTQIVTKLNNFKCDKTKKKTQTVINFKISNWDENLKLKL